MKRTISALFILLTVASHAHADIIYTITPKTLGADGYGFSGTITTDGSLGLFSDLTHITNWAITLNTPSAADGIGTHELNMGNSSSTFDFGDGAQLSLTPTEFAFTPTAAVVTQDTMRFASTGDPTGDYIEFFSAGPVALSSQIQIRDGSENPSLGLGGGSAAGNNLVIATAVPEPTSSFLVTVGAFGLLAFRRRR